MPGYNLDQLFGSRAATKKEEPEVVDRSRAQRYATCPLQGHLVDKYGLDKETSQDELVQIGQAGHALVKEAWDFCQGDREGMVDFIANELPKTRPDLQPKVLEHAKYLMREIAATPGAIIGVECQIEAMLNGLMCTTALDVLVAGTNSLIVNDWKMGFKKRSNQEAFEDFQTQYGSWTLWQQYPDNELIHWWYKETRWGTKAYARLERHAVDARMPDLTQELAFQGRISQTLRLMAEGCKDAWPEPKKCAWCPAIMQCTKANGRAADVAKNPAKFVDQLTILQERVKAMKTSAADYYQKHGPIMGTKTKFEWRPSKPKFAPRLYVNKDNGNEDEN